jgi:hypothetical protein
MQETCDLYCKQIRNHLIILYDKKCNGKATLHHSEDQQVDRTVVQSKTFVLEPRPHASNRVREV